MHVKCLFKYFAIAVGVQIGILLLSRYSHNLVDFLLFYVYWPWISLATTLTGAKGEDAMIMPPVLGLLGGVIFYSLIAGIMICYFKGRRTNTTQS